MNFLDRLFGIEKKSQNIIGSFDLMDGDAWSRFGLSSSRGKSLTEGTAYLAFRQHELVYACIQKLADVMNDAEIIVERSNSEGEWEPVSGHSLTALFKRPNKNQTGRDVRRLLVQSEQCMGQFYALVNRSAAGIPVEMQVLNPLRVNPRFNEQTGELLRYEYQKTNGRLVVIKPEDMLTRRRADLINQFSGYAPLLVALKSINSDLGLTDYVDAFFESDGVPSGILKILNQSISDVKKEALRDRWMAKFKRRGSSQKGIAVLDQDATFERIGSNLNELASESLSGRFEARICSVFGVPPNLVGAYVGLQHVTANATAKADLRNFWDNKVSPELAGLREWLTWFVLPLFEDIDAIKADKIRVGFDISQAGFLQDDVDGIHDRARKNLQAGGWTVNEFREATGQKPDPDGDYYIQPSALLPISPDNRSQMAFEKVEAGKEANENEKPATDATDDESDTDKDRLDDPKADELSKKNLKSGEVSKNFDYDGLMLHREPTEIEKAIDLKKIVGERSDLAESLAKVLFRLRVSLIDQAVKKLADATPAESLSLQLVPDAKARKATAKAIREAYLTGGEQVRRELRKPSKAKDDDRTDEILDDITDSVITKMVSEVRSRALNAYITLKMLLDFTVERLKALLEGESVKFLDLLAENAVNAAMQRGRGDEGKRLSEEWRTVIYSAILDSGTCGPCEDADGEEAEDPADLPAAPNPECAGGANCRCMHVYVAASER